MAVLCADIIPTCSAGAQIGHADEKLVASSPSCKTAMFRHGCGWSLKGLELIRTQILLLL